ncbi:hypothetical protein [Acidianus sp. HS-5]|uniref:hypothetical protein n=1 Tax=Acidianus sp. HS-5 TaxID=2886040 RepID=UPI001F263650|nr:hypothetical protein [Acidianus sp. HS-5]BDC18171.1 hypothetical protein HS5_10610 [Acidianus sp. HS-5]
MKKTSKIMVVLLIIFLALSVYSIDKVISSITIPYYIHKPSYYSFMLNGTEYIYITLPHFRHYTDVKLEFNNSVITCAYAIVTFYPVGINIIKNASNTVTLCGKNPITHIHLHPGLYKVVYIIGGCSSKPIPKSCISKYVSIKIC